MGYVMWQQEPESSRPQPPPNMDRSTAAQLFGGPITFLKTHPSLGNSRQRLLQSITTAVQSLSRAETLYSDDCPKSAVGLAHEWNQCRSRAETLKQALIAYTALLAEEEGE